MANQSRYSKLSDLQFRATRAEQSKDINQIMPVWNEMRELLKPKYPAIQFFQKSIIGRGEDNIPLLIRWNIFGCKYFMLRLHKFCKSDHDCLHDHPWNFITLILKNGYYEKMENGRKFRHAGTVLYRPATFKHAVQLHDKKPSWSLVLTLKVKRSWGFWQNGNWTHWMKFNSKNKCD